MFICEPHHDKWNKDTGCPYCREDKLEAENKALRRTIDNIRIRSYELGRRELHDRALKALEVKE